MIKKPSSMRVPYLKKKKSVFFLNLIRRSKEKKILINFLLFNKKKIQIIKHEVSLIKYVINVTEAAHTNTQQ